MKLENIKEIITESRRVFFVGIGGVSMASLARYLKAEGKEVLGSDRAESDNVRSLRLEGIRVFPGHNANNVDGADALVFTGAVDDSNPEIKKAKEMGIPVISRAVLLGALMLDSPVRIGIAGTHGKSTTTAMLADILLAAGNDPTIMCGASLPSINGAYRRGSGAFLFEACEYKDSFLSFCPSIAAILNVDYDHTDYFPSIESVISSFGKYAAIPGEKGHVITCADDENALKAAGDALTFGFSPSADYRCEGLSENGGFYSFTVLNRGEKTDVTLGVPGRHNVMNALAAFACADVAGIEKRTIAEALSSFSGLSRRFERRGSVGGADVYIDYAHHPREIRAAIDAARKMTSGKIITVFEPHTFSRTRSLYDDFTNAFENADVKIFTDIFAARESETLGVSSKMLALDAGGVYAESYSVAAKMIKTLAAEGDTVLILGAGTIFKVADIIGERYARTEDTNGRD